MSFSAVHFALFSLFRIVSLFLSMAGGGGVLSPSVVLGVPTFGGGSFNEVEELELSIPEGGAAKILMQFSRPISGSGIQEGIDANCFLNLKPKPLLCSVHWQFSGVDRNLGRKRRDGDTHI